MCREETTATIWAGQHSEEICGGFVCGGGYGQLVLVSDNQSGGQCGSLLPMPAASEVFRASQLGVVFDMSDGLKEVSHSAELSDCFLCR